MGCDSQFDGYYDGERKARARDKVEMRQLVRKVVKRSSIGDPVDNFIDAVRAVIRDQR